MKNIEEFMLEEKKRAINISDKIIDKPKISMMVVIFPFLLINFIQELRIYRYKKEFFLKEYLYLKNLVVKFLKNKPESDLRKVLEKELIKDEKYLEFYECQIQEALSIKKYIYQEENEENMRAKEIDTIKKIIEIFKLDGDKLDVTLKLLKVIN
ncbi:MULTISPECIES: hypothetical protein [Cetobacterium]|jgi:hypothetical protein|uniref:Uncharacterized protein n=1 Tax=Candidatus Cetobacterium colombiensis TaxID=3073100 RepID=A0ABU4WAY0_9FUSO|nr:hypothetical protein [Candidatus Cetobacterium colombiensis]MDX8336702.1 hypothetical protein [Candidatus Cetobacterium colombiensis]